MSLQRHPTTLNMGEDLFQFPSPLAVQTAPPPNISPLKPTAAYDTYWRFAAERQDIFFRRLSGSPSPWTSDPILQSHKFTNAYRASDRVSQYLIRQVIYSAELPDTFEETMFRILLFKFFNRIDTWELLARSLGPLTWADFDFTRYDKVLSKALSRDIRIYSAAYIMPSGGSLGHRRKHRNHLVLIERMMRDEVWRRIQDAPTMQRAFDLLLAYPTIGDFLAYQYVTDLNYGPTINYTEKEFVMPGPGALEGIHKCFSDTGGLNEAEVIRFMADRQELEFERLGLNFRTLWGRPLQLIDCQNLFCEVNKYARVYHPELNGKLGRTRIKQRFTPNTETITYWFPPKWEINELARTHREWPIPEIRSSSMDLYAYQQRAAKTDRNPDTTEKGMMIPLLGLAGESGELLTEYKKFLRDGDSHVHFRDRFSEELGDVLWYLANLATKLGLNLGEVAEQNLRKCEHRFGPSPKRTPFDEGYPENERFPRRFLVDFVTIHDKTERPIVRVFYQKQPFGDELTDNASEPDGYAFHDAIHLSFAAVLGWSPMTRKLLNAKRKSNSEVDEVQDGARARYTEEGISTVIFAYARNYNWLEGQASVSTIILRMLKDMTAHLEVGICTEGEWERAIMQGFSVWREIKKRGAGTLVVNLDERSISVKDAEA